MDGVSQPVRRSLFASSDLFLIQGCPVSLWHGVIAAILGLALCCLPSSVRAQADITVDATTVTGAVNPLLFGQNVLFSNGMWDTRTNELHSGAASLVHDLTPWILRFPGGSHSDLYLWEDALGPKTTAAVSAGTAALSLESAPDWDTVSSGRLIDAAGGQFGETFTFRGVNGTQLQGVSGVSASHSAGVEVRPGQRQGQPSWFSHQYGVDEHMKLATSLGAEVILTVNYGSGLDRSGAVSTSASVSQRVKRAAAWVAYLNGAPTDLRPLGIDAEGTDWQTVGFWAQKRVARGHSAPYGVHYWEIGNEVFGSWEVGFTTARQYATDCLQFITTMKSIDPTIAVGAAALSTPHGRGDADSVEEWNSTVVRIAGDVLDFLIVHPYYPAANLAQAQGSYASLTWFTAVMAGATQTLADLAGIRAEVAAVSARGGQLGLVVTEYGMWPAESTTAPDYSNLGRALHDADLLMQLLAQGRRLNVLLATAWNLHGSNETAAVGYDWSTGTRVVRPQYYAYQLMRDLAPQLLNTTVSAPTFSAPQVGNVDAMAAIPLLAAVAGTDGDRHLTLLVLNRSLSNSIATGIHLRGCTPQSTATVRTLTAASLAAHNETSPATVVVKTASFSAAAATFGYTFPAHSLSMIELQAAPTATLPTAFIKAAPLQGKAPLSVTFNGSGSRAAGSGLIVNYTWNFGDGGPMVGVTSSHSYANPGTYIVTLLVTDNAGLSGTAATTVTVSRARGKKG
ncbi:MAG TPA: PKD domain-containing protein [Candidatus Binatia bacterium]|nr:PKD domain-containing protein [Candidatus Binatia bacterium]